MRHGNFIELGFQTFGFEHPNFGLDRTDPNSKLQSFECGTSIESFQQAEHKKAQVVIT